MKTIYLAAGCFWGTQKFFDQFDGIAKTTVGYANGNTENPSYDWLAIYPAGIEPTYSNYSSATISNGKLAGHGNYEDYTKPDDTDSTYHRVFTAS